MAKMSVMTEMDYIKAIRKADREFEIERYGKQVSMRSSHRHESKKAYSRKNYKIEW